MSPIEITSVDMMNAGIYAAMGLVGASILCLALAAIDKFLEYRSNVNGNPVISMTHRTLTKTALGLLFLALLAYLVGVAIYDSESKNSFETAITELEQETGTTILNRDSILPGEVLLDHNSIPVSFKDEDKVYEGRLIIEDWEMLLYVERTNGGQDELVVFGS